MTDIVIGSSNIVTGGGAYAIVADVINASWNYGLVKSTDYSNKINAAVGTGGFLSTVDTPTVTAGSVAVPTVTAPAVDIPASASATDVMSMFDTKYLELVTLLSDKFTAFRTTFFPNEASGYALAENWLKDAINNPDSGLPLAVQEQIFEEDRSRITADTARASDAVLTQFAARRFPLPPGAAASAVLQIQQKSQDELAESSRKIAILSVENMKFAIEKTLGARQAAMSAAVEYIKALASGPEMASRLVGIGYDAQSKLISAASQFYAADTQAKEMVNKVAQYNNSLSFEAASKNQAASLNLIEDKLKALLAEAQALAQMSTSLFNNVHASAGISAGVSNGVSYSYSNDTVSAAPTIGSFGG